MNIKIMFPAGLTFIFGSLVCTEDDFDVLNHHLVQNATNQSPPALHQDTLEDLIENFDKLMIYSPTRTQKQQLESNSNTTKFSESASKRSDNCGPNLVRLPLGLKSIASVS